MTRHPHGWLELTALVYTWLETTFLGHKIEVYTYHNWGDEIMLTIPGSYECVLVIMETTVQICNLRHKDSEIFNASDPEFFQKLEKEITSRKFNWVI